MRIPDVALGRRESFGVAARFTEVFSLIFRLRPGIFIGFNLLALAALLALTFATVLVVPDEGGEAVLGFVALVGFALVSLIGAGVMSMAGCDALTGERRSVSTYLGRTASRLPTLVVLGLIALLLAGLGFAVIGIVGLWVSAVYSVFVPAAVSEDASWGALGRSQQLTREYRWPIVGLILLVGLTAFLLSLLPTAQLLGLTYPGSDLVAGVLSIATQFINLSILGAVPPVIYARLRAIKEGDGVERLGAVFS